MGVFGTVPDEDGAGDGSADAMRRDEELQVEAYNAFMRLQLVRQKAVSLNNAMIAMRDSKGELSAAFEWLDICTDTLNSAKIDRKKVKDLQGSMYTPASQTVRQVMVLPESISDLSLKVIDNAIGRVTDTESRGKGKALFAWLVSKLTQGKVMQRSKIAVGELLVFKYSLEKMIDREIPDLFVGSMIHRYMPVTRPRIAKVLSEIKSKRRTRTLASLLSGARCHCPRLREGPHEPNGECRGDCQTAYACFYNASDRHPFLVSKDDYSHYFAHLYPHLGKLERLSKEMKTKYRGRRQFESIADMVFNILAKHRASTAATRCHAGLGPDGREDPQLVPVSGTRSPGHTRGSVPLRRDRERRHAEDPRRRTRASALPVLQQPRGRQAVPSIHHVQLHSGQHRGASNGSCCSTSRARRGQELREQRAELSVQASERLHRDAHVLHSASLQVQVAEERLRGNDRRRSHHPREKHKGVGQGVQLDPQHVQKSPGHGVLESGVVSRDANSGKVDTVKYHAVHNCSRVEHQHAGP
ncbi:hypothetical protein Q5P01_016610 [Channa striata]|uniref:Uncharacterized protein n=1 Tax=Channa striata TaxID=64152 RepID=A0AA88MBV7_CHASR|nr:hypothetical protein Q5P01_016610 [Channa striata]